MYLNDQDRSLFFKLYFDLLYCVNKAHKIVKGLHGGRYPKSVSQSDALHIRNALFEHPEWIDEYLSKYGDERTSEEHDILVAWRDHFIKSDFFVMRNLKKYTVFMHTAEQSATKLYGIVGLNHPISEIFEKQQLPLMINALILPFKEKIIYDGIVTSYNMRIGSGMRNNLNAEYRASKEQFGIVESLPVILSKPKCVIKLPVQEATTKSETMLDEKIGEIAARITDICGAHLNDEYVEVSLRLLDKLQSLQPSPLLKGKVNTWASGIVYAIGSTNFLFDKTQSPHMRATELASLFGISQSTAGNKAGEIYKLLDIIPFDPEWTLPGNLADNPFIWMFETNDGYILDARTTSRETQESLLAAGLIPFIPPPREETVLKQDKSEPAPKPQKEKQSQEIVGQLRLDDM